MTDKLVHIDGKKMIIAYLKEHGFTGLCQSAADCGCQISDLFPCDSEWFWECEAGYKENCTPKCNHSEPCDWHIRRPTKAEVADDKRNTVYEPENERKQKVYNTAKR